MNFKPNTYGYIAKRDLNDALQTKENLPHVAVYSAQQAVEKILKHYLTLNYNGSDRTDIFKSHKLYLLALKSGIPELKHQRDFLNTLTQYYFDGRYPGIDFMEPTVEDARDIVPKAVQIFKIIEDNIEPDSNLKKMSLF